MNLKTLIVVELHVVAVLVVAGVLAYYFWILPNKLQKAGPAETAVQGAPPLSPDMPIIAPVAPPPAQPAAKPVVQPGQPTAKPASPPAVQPAAAVVDDRDNIILDGRFDEGMKRWSYWKAARDHKEQVSIVAIDYAKAKRALRICDPQGVLMGMQQIVSVESGKVYRLTGSARSLGTLDSNVLFGGRIGFYMDKQKEHELKWVTENTNWWEQYVVISNKATGAATIFIHMGYGDAPSTGEFTGIKLELCR